MKTYRLLFVLLGLATVVLLISFLRGAPSMKSSADESGIRKIATAGDLRKVLDTAGSKLIVFDMYADWCGPCRLLLPTIKTLSEQYAGQAQFYRINVDENPGAAAAFGTRGIPFVVFVKDGRPVASLVGVNPKHSYDSLIVKYSGTPSSI